MFVLLLRQILILLCVILAPIALVLWILPGTNRYYKMWSDNFSKMLILFPILMGIIACGRIFAFISANAGSATTAFHGGGNLLTNFAVDAASTSKFFAIFAVLGGFFGVYAVFPRAFTSWGGSALSGVNGALKNATKWRKQPQQFALNQSKVNRKANSEARHERMGYGEGSRGDRLISSLGGIGQNQRARHHRQAHQLAEGREVGEKAVQQQIIGSPYEQQDHGAKLLTLTNLAQGGVDPATNLSGENPAMQRWALDQLAQFGDWNIIDGARTGGHIDDRTWQTFVAKNIGEIHKNAPYLSPIKRDLSTVAAEETGGWKDHTFQEFEEQLRSGEVRNTAGDGTDPALTGAARATQLRNGVAMAEAALTDERISSRLSPNAKAALERIRNMGTPEVRVTPNRRGGGARVSLPSPQDIATNPAARESVTTHLLDEVTAAPGNKHVTTEIGSQLASTNLTGTDRQALENYMTRLRRQAQSSGSAEAKQAYNDVIDQWNAQLDQRVKQAEQEAIAAGLRGPAINAQRATAQADVNAEKARIAPTHSKL